MAGPDQMNWTRHHGPSSKEQDQTMLQNNMISHILLTGHIPYGAQCDFESDLCGWWDIVGPDQLNWTRHHGPTKSAETGPSVDHTLGTAEGMGTFGEVLLILLQHYIVIVSYSHFVFLLISSLLMCLILPKIETMKMYLL